MGKVNRFGTVTDAALEQSHRTGVVVDDLGAPWFPEPAPEPDESSPAPEEAEAAVEALPATGPDPVFEAIPAAPARKGK